MDDVVQADLDRRRQLTDAVQAALVEHLFLQVEAGDLDPDAPLFGSGHGLDSIDAVELIVMLEERFHTRLQDARAHAVRHLRTVNTIVDRVLETEGT